MVKSNFMLAILSLSLLFITQSCESQPATPKDVITAIPMEVPHIDKVGMLEIQPEQTDTDVIWYDAFDEEKEYMGYKGAIDFTSDYGTSGGSMNAGFKKGEVTGEGNRQLAFGDFPGGKPVVNEGQSYNEIYWRIYVKHQHGWEGAPAKMSRATSIVTANWCQAMILHVWSGSGNSLTLDPASGVNGMTDSIVTIKYNDFDHLRWLGNRPESEFKISATNESGYWVPVEARARLNTPGKSDGLAQLWINGKLEAERTNLNFRGTYTAYGINAVFLEVYWNSGAVKTEGRWFDNFVVSTKAIGPVSTSTHPEIFKTPYYGPNEQGSWDLEIAADSTGSDVVYGAAIHGLLNSTTVSVENGEFTGTLAGHSALTPGIYFCRVRQKSSMDKQSAWSEWHQPFRVTGKK